MNRAGVEKYILTNIGKLLPGNTYNIDLYKKMFKNMNDKQFKQFIDDLDTGKKHLVFNKPGFTKEKLSIKRNLKLAEEIGCELFTRIWVGPNGDEPKYLTPVKHLVVRLPIRRTAQTIIKKVSVGEDTKTIDPSTGQPTGKSQAAAVSFTGLQLLSALNLEKTVTELIKYRGGDIGGFRALNAMVSKYGEVKQEVIANYSTEVVSKRTLRTYLQACHLNNNL